MTWYRVWMEDYAVANIEEQRMANTALLNANVLGGELSARLSDTAHVLAAVARATPENQNE